MLWILLIIFLLMDSSISRPTNRSNAVGEKLCRIGNISFPISIFESYVGWECYEESYRGMIKLTVHVCVETAGDEEYNIPCFKSKERVLNFNLKNEETVLSILEASGSRKLNDEMIRCYLNTVAACETSSNGWLEFHGGYKSFVSNITENICNLEGQSKFHIAMLSISLIIGIPIAIVFFYCGMATKNLLLFHCRNLILALIMRTFFSLLIETEVITEMIKSPPEEPFINWAGCEALASFETISLNLVHAFWLILTFYLFVSSKTRFHKVPEIGKGFYIVLGLAVTFAIIWIIIMAVGDYGHCWLERTPIQWVNDALRLGFILLQIFLVSVICYHALTDEGKPADTQTKLLMKVTLFLILLSPIFLLQFSLSASHPVEIEEEAHIYTEFFFDGLQCAFVSSVILYNFLFILSDFDFIVYGLRSCLGRNKECHRVFETMGGTEMEIRQGDAPPRVGRLPMKNADDEESKDITYTSVLSPERFEKTIKLYNRLNVISMQEVSQDNLSVKSEYFDVDNESVDTVYNDVLNQILDDTKQRYYNSKYLVHDTESSGTDESVIELTSEKNQKLSSISSSSSSSSTIVLPPEELDISQEIEKWLRNCQCEFQEYAKKLKNKSEIQMQNTLHRTLSGNIVIGKKFPGSVKIDLKISSKNDLVQGKKGSDPSLITYEKEEILKKNELPSIYDDLKKYSRERNNKFLRKQDFNSNWSIYRNRILEKRRKVKSSNDFEISNSIQNEIGPQPNILVNERNIYERHLDENKFDQNKYNISDKNDSESDKRIVMDNIKPLEIKKISQFYDIIEKL